MAIDDSPGRAATQLTVHSHYVPEHYLKAWATGRARIWAYQIVVPKASEPEWKQRAVSSVAVQSHFYTSILGGSPSDRFERWLNESVEQPAIEAIDLVRADKQLKPHHWRRLAYYIAALDRRTPAAYIEQMRWYEANVPGMIGDVLGELQRRVDAGERIGFTESAPNGREPGPGEMPIRVRRVIDPNTGRLAAQVEVTIGRELWLHDVRRLLETRARSLTEHRWIVLRPPRGSEWFTTDHPVIRLHYNGPNEYTFEGGWGQKGAEILLPLSPEHLLYTKVGDRRFRHHTGSEQLARDLRRFQAERAHRWVFARTPQDDIPMLRPREVDLTRYIAERDEWARFHAQQSATAATGATDRGVSASDADRRSTS